MAGIGDCPIPSFTAIQPPVCIGSRLQRLQLTVTLTSGGSESLSISESSKVGDLKNLAQTFFRQRFSRLVTAEASILRDPMQTLQAAGLQDGDQLTANVGDQTSVN